MSDPAAIGDHIVDSHETASFITLALCDNNLISKNVRARVTALLTELRYSDFRFDHDETLVCHRTLDRKGV